MPDFETERLILRRLQPEDAEAFHREIYSDPEVVRYYNGGRVFSLEEIRAFLPLRRNTGQFGYWTVTLKETGESIGQIHIDPYANQGWYILPDEAPILCHPPEVHLGFAFGRRFWGQGYASEACRALIRYAFRDLRLQRLLGGADIRNDRSLRLHERLGFRLIYHKDDVVAVLTNPLAAYRIRPFEERDRQAADATGSPVVNWWHTEVPGASLHLVAEHAETSEIVGHLQARDRSVPEPTRRPGQCHLLLSVLPEHRRRGIGGCLYERAEAFARSRKAALLYAAYHETPDAPAASFLRERGFEPLERFLPSTLDITCFEPAEFADSIRRVEQQGVTLTTYAELGDSPENRQRLYALEEAARSTQPFREVEPYVATPYDKWKTEFTERDRTAIFLALAPICGEFVGVVTSLEWYFTGVGPDWRGRGIATALKVRCIQEAKSRGMELMETENHEDNAAMLAVNRRLGFVFAAPEVACLKRMV